jgi:hypothetical protein
MTASSQRHALDKPLRSEFSFPSVRGADRAAILAQNQVQSLCSRSSASKARAKELEVSRRPRGRDPMMAVTPQHPGELGTERVQAANMMR